MQRERARKTWRLLFRQEERIGEMTHKPEQSQEPQHLRCGVITTNNVEALGGSEILLSSCYVGGF